MLVLSRKENESIVIGGGIEIFVLGVHRGRVKLGVSAPKETPVVRSEIVDRDVGERVIHQVSSLKQFRKGAT